MNNKVTFIFAFMLGAAAGTAVAWKVLKTKYDEILEQEIEDIYEVVNRKLEVTDNREPCDENLDEEDETEEEDEDDSEDIRKMEDLLTSSNYIDYSSVVIKEDKKEEVASVRKPYVISPEDFGEEDDYEIKTLIYYDDGILADEQNNVIKDVDSVVGRKSLNHFGEYQDDSVFVRNENRRIDYEILLDLRKYSDVVKSKPHRAED